MKEKIKILKIRWFLILVCLIGVRFVHAYETTIEVVDSYVEEGSNDLPTSYVKLHVRNTSNPSDIVANSEIVLSSDCKSSSSVSVIYQNKEKTIVGFNSSNALINYRINLIYIVNNEQIINQNLGVKISEILRKNVPDIFFESSGLFLANITGTKVTIGFKSDSEKGSFNFQIEVKKDGSIKFVPGSLKLHALPEMGASIIFRNHRPV